MYGCRDGWISIDVWVCVWLGYHRCMGVFRVCFGYYRISNGCYYGWDIDVMGVCCGWISPIDVWVSCGWDL